VAKKRAFVFNDKAKQAYLLLLEKSGLPYKSAKSIGTSGRRMLSECEQDKEFATACEDAMHFFRESVEEEVYRRAVEGVEEPVFYKGSVCGHVTKYSDTMLSLLVKKENPAFGEKLKVDTTIHGGVLLTLPVAPTAQEWLDGTQEAPQLPAAENEENESDLEKNVIDVECETEPVPVG
jgi:hypothetical protein